MKRASAKEKVFSLSLGAQSARKIYEKRGRSVFSFAARALGAFLLSFFPFSAALLSEYSFGDLTRSAGPKGKVAKNIPRKPLQA